MYRSQPGRLSCLAVRAGNVCAASRRRRPPSSPSRGPALVPVPGSVPLDVAPTNQPAQLSTTTPSKFRLARNNAKRASAPATDHRTWLTSCANQFLARRSNRRPDVACARPKRLQLLVGGSARLGTRAWRRNMVKKTFLSCHVAGLETRCFLRWRKS